jgi:hypothetical protein
MGQKLDQLVTNAAEVRLMLTIQNNDVSNLYYFLLKLSLLLLFKNRFSHSYVTTSMVLPHLLKDYECVSACASSRINI